MTTGPATDGARFVEFAAKFLTLNGSFAGQPFVPLPWMREAVDDIFRLDDEGRRVHRTYLLGVPRKNAKALALDTKVATTRGVKTVGAVKAGDYVFGSDGHPTEVLAASEVFTGRDCYRVSFKDGQSVVACGEHLWTVWDASVGRTVTVDTTTLAENVMFSGGRRWSVPQAGRCTEESTIPVDPYLLGYWLGDGHTGTGRISVHDDDVPSLEAQVVEAGLVLERKHYSSSLVLVRSPFVGMLREALGGATKRMPEGFREWGTEQRRALLGGLLDSDGTTSKAGQASFTNTNRGLAMGVLELSRSLGVKTTMIESRAFLYGKDCGPVWRVTMTPLQTDRFFRLERKAERCKVSRSRANRNKIVSVTRVPSVPTKCLAVAAEDKLFQVSDGILTHNSTLGAAIAVYMLIADRSDAQPLVVSAAGDRAQARLVFDMAKGMIEASPELRDICTIYRQEIRNNRNGGRYIVVSADAGRAHGLNPSTVIVDEYHVHKNNDLFVALTSGSAMRREPLTLVISTAGTIDSPLWHLYETARRVQTGEIDDKSLGMTWYGPPAGDFDHRDPAVWEAANPSWELMNAQDFQSALAISPEADFIRYRLNGWVASKTAFLPAGAWEELATGERLAAGDRVVLGFDGSWKGDSTALVAVRVDDLHAELLGVWEAPVDDPQARIPTAEVEQSIRDACGKYKVLEVAMDPYRWEQTIQALTDEGLPIVEFNSAALTLMVPATTTFYQIVMDKGMSHAGDPALDRHLRNAVVKSDHRGTRITRQNAGSTAHIDAAVALIIGVSRAVKFREPDQEVVMNESPLVLL